MSLWAAEGLEIMNETERGLITASVATHICGEGGPSIALPLYLVEKGVGLVWIRHPLIPKSKDISELRRYSGGSLVENQKKWAGRTFKPLMYIRDVIYTLWWMLRSPPVDVYIGIDALNALTGVILKWLGKAKRVALFTIDFVPRRFESRWLNWVYHTVDRFCLRYCDQVWDLSPRMIEGRKGRDGGRFAMRAQHVIVPIGAWHSRIPRLTVEQIQRHLVGFLGRLQEKQGVQLVVSALQKVRDSVPEARLRVIGDGPYGPELRRKVSAMGLDDAVEFIGYVEDHREVERLLSECAFAVALYNPDLDDFSYYADPGKVKTFLAAALPVIVTSVPWVAQEIDARRAGFVIPYDEAAVTEAMLALLRDDSLLREYRANATAMARDYDYALIFSRALKSILPDWSLESDGTESKAIL